VGDHLDTFRRQRLPLGVFPQFRTQSWDFKLDLFGLKITGDLGRLFLINVVLMVSLMVFLNQWQLLNVSSPVTGLAFFVF
jgi:hypothetical protein